MIASLFTFDMGGESHDIPLLVILGNNDKSCDHLGNFTR